ncbi:MAG TPA: hypothetical protein VFO89_17655 [Thermoanaerobaculia bacterium]|nr:hypothetical protein [Thermoanaerobaculia bacterium]
MAGWQRTKRIALILGGIGIVLEIAALTLLANGSIPSNVATPVIIGGMLLAFVPLFVVARHAKRK